MATLHQTGEPQTLTQLNDHTIKNILTLREDYPYIYIFLDALFDVGLVVEFRNKTLCNGLADFSELQSECGRPLGLRFNHQTNELYVADAYFGLVKIGPNGGAPIQSFKALQPQEHSDNSTLEFLDGIDIDVDTGIVYFTQASTNFHFK